MGTLLANRCRCSRGLKLENNHEEREGAQIILISFFAISVSFVVIGSFIARSF